MKRFSQIYKKTLYYLGRILDSSKTLKKYDPSNITFDCRSTTKANTNNPSAPVPQGELLHLSLFFLPLCKHLHPKHKPLL